MSVVVFLQNAWSPLYAGSKWPRKSWLRALARSRSGQRIRLMIDDYDLCENTTAEVAATPDGVCQPDCEHIADVIERRKPSLVICCGKQARTALELVWSGKMIAVPHPAYRLLTNEVYEKVRTCIENPVCMPWPRFEIVQLRENIQIKQITESEK